MNVLIQDSIRYKWRYCSTRTALAIATTIKKTANPGQAWDIHRGTTQLIKQVAKHDMPDLQHLWGPWPSSHYTHEIFRALVRKAHAAASSLVRRCCDV